MKKAIVFIFITMILLSIYLAEAGSKSPYSVQKIKRNDGAMEYRCFYLTQHFMSVISDNGAVVIRPHPGFDVNGWGSSWYAQPFLSGAILDNSKIKASATKSGISITGSGKVSGAIGKVQDYGSWKINLILNYNITKKRIYGTGAYSIKLRDYLNKSNRDLNLYKIASNYLDNVPLIDDGIGDTGDMEKADVMGDNLSFSWKPDEQPGYFPDDLTKYLSINVLGQYNNVDTQAQGYSAITPAWKPSLKVDLSSDKAKMIFGGIYDTGKSKDFWEDNVGITPLILKNSADKEFNFYVKFESQALPEDN